MRVNQWSVGLQREITKNLVVEAAYVGNRSVWQNAGALMGLNLLSEERLRAFGLDINNAAHRTLLNSRMNTAAAISAGFDRLPYASFSPNNTVAQSLRPFPQFGNIGVQRAPLGKSWYDSLQAKATKRYSRGLRRHRGIHLAEGADHQRTRRLGCIQSIQSQSLGKFSAFWCWPPHSITNCRETPPIR